MHVVIGEVCIGPICLSFTYVVGWIYWLGCGGMEWIREFWFYSVSQIYVVFIYGLFVFVVFGGRGWTVCIMIM